MGKYGVTSKLVWDGGGKIAIPEEMGKPRTDQLQGSVYEQLSELAGRVCYDMPIRLTPKRAIRSILPHGGLLWLKAKRGGMGLAK